MIKRLPFFLTSFLLFFLPFVILPFGSSQFEVPKVIVSQIAIELLVVIRLFQKDLPKIPKWSLISLIILFGISFADLIFFRTQYSFFGNSFRLQGIFLLWHLLLFSVFAEKHVLGKVWAKGVLLFLIVQLCGDFFFGVNDVGRSFGFLGEPNSLAAVALFAFPLLFINKNRMKLTGICLLLITVVLIISGSRSGVMGFFIECFFLLAVFRFPKRYKTILVFSVFLVGLTFFTPFISSNLHESRVEIWYAAFLSFLRSPLIGGGFGNIDVLIHRESLTFASFISVRYVDSSHNIFLDMLVQSGLIGFGAFLALVAKAMHVFCKNRDTVAIALLLGFVTILSFNPVSVWVLIVFWYLVGQGVTGNKVSEHVHV